MWDQLETSDGLAGPNVRRLSVSPENNIWVATSTGLTRIGDTTQDRGLPSRVGLQARPNPRSTHTNLIFSETLSSGARIDVLDMQGRTLRTMRGTGGREVMLHRQGLASGISPSA